MSLYRNILRQAFIITWQNKFLWIFGLFAFLLISNSGEFDILFRTLSGNGTGLPVLQELLGTNLFSAEGMRNFATIYSQEPATMTILMLTLVFIFAVFLFLLWIMNVSQAALVKSVALITGKNEPASLAKGFNWGMKKFWPVFGFNALLKLVLFLLFLLIGYFVNSLYGTDNVNSVIVFFTLLIAVIFSVVLSFIVKYSVAYSVIKDKKFGTAMKRGWNLFKNNWLISIEMAFILFFINLSVSILLILSAIILAIPLLFLAFLFYEFVSYQSLYLFMLLILLLMVLLMAVIGAIWSTFHISSWTGLFIELEGRGGQSKLNRIFSKENNK